MSTTQYLIAVILQMLLGLWAQCRVKSAFGICTLGEFLDPSHKQLCLSSAVYHEPSIAALGIAAHEAGHTIHDYRSLTSRDRN